MKKKIVKFVMTSKIILLLYNRVKGCIILRNLKWMEAKDNAN